MRKGAWEEASAALAQALRTEGEHALATFLFAVVLRRRGKIHESLIALERAGQLGGDEVGHARAFLLLQLGRLDEAMELWGRPRSRGTAQALSLEGVDRLLILPDPDPTITLALLRGVPVLHARGVEVSVAAPGAYAGLLRHLTAPVRALSPSAPVPEGIAVVSLRRLPLLLGEPGKVPWSGPYLRAPEGVAARGGRIGVCVEGPIEDWCGRSGCPRGWAEPAWGEVMDRLGPLGEVIRLRPDTPFEALIEQIAGLDLVVTLDGRVAHLAAALGRPLIVLLDASGGWAWPEAHERSPWYPDAHLVRETARADFTLPLDRVAELAARVLGGG
jgi:hypothetical protein